MKTEFAILSPSTGLYVRALTKEEAAQKMAEEAMRLYMIQCQNAPVSVVQTNDEGAETWFTAEGEQYPDMTIALQQTELATKNLEALRSADTLVVTTLGG